MTKTKLISMVAAATVAWLSFSASLFGAETLRTESFNLESTSSGYRLVIPGYLEHVVAEGKSGDGKTFRASAVVMEKPKPGSDGTYPLFEIETNDKTAYTLDAYPGTYGSGQMASFTRQFKDGKVTFSVNEKMMESISDQVFTFPFMVLDKQGSYVTDFSEIAIVFAGSQSPAYTTPTVTVSAKPASTKIAVNGKNVSFDAYLIEGSHYFKLRDLAMAIRSTPKRFEVKWDGAANRVDMLKEAVYSPVGGEIGAATGRIAKQGKLSASSFYVDGAKTAFASYKIGGSNYVKLRDMAAVIDFSVTWQEASKTVGIDTSKAYTPEQ